MCSFPTGGKKVTSEVHSSMWCLVGPEGSVQIENMVGVRHTRGQSVLHFPGGGRWQLLAVPGPFPQELWPQERSQGWGTFRDSLTSACPPATFQAPHKRWGGQWLTEGSHGVEQCFVASDDFPGVNTPTVTDIKLPSLNSEQRRVTLLAGVSPSEHAPADLGSQLSQAHHVTSGVSRDPGGQEPATLGVPEPWGCKTQWDHLILAPVISPTGVPARAPDMGTEAVVSPTVRKHQGPRDPKLDLSPRRRLWSERGADGPRAWFPQ